MYFRQKVVSSVEEKTQGRITMPYVVGTKIVFFVAFVTSAKIKTDSCQSVDIVHDVKLVKRKNRVKESQQLFDVRRAYNAITNNKTQVERTQSA